MSPPAPPRRNSVSEGPAFNASALRIAVILEDGEERNALVRELQRSRASVTSVWPMPAEIPIEHDVVFCQVWRDLPRRLPWLPGHATSALVLVSRQGSSPDGDMVEKCAPQAVLQLPAAPGAVTWNLMLARNQFLYERRLRSRIDKLDDNLRTIRAVERAKSLLMEKRKLNEEEAYHFLRRTAMQKRVSVGSLANAIIDSSDLLEL
ncbi:MAG: ANTAR domain-containing protein [Rhodovibrionaceae bacterium]